MAEQTASKTPLTEFEKWRTFIQDGDLLQRAQGIHWVMNRLVGSSAGVVSRLNGLSGPEKAGELARGHLENPARRTLINERAILLNAACGRLARYKGLRHKVPTLKAEPGVRTYRVLTASEIEACNRVDASLQGYNLALKAQDAAEARRAALAAKEILHTTVIRPDDSEVSVYDAMVDTMGYFHDYVEASHPTWQMPDVPRVSRNDNSQPSKVAPTMVRVPFVHGYAFKRPDEE